ncbi:hypothetical protein LSH36_341g02015 [Paralvinella palmiformis]|uniref:Uncharacterized protein n=1 Tax=Paralvinella palmiformis TaxID=53620 RepID=A0AAD9N1X1_9ANNE|nr:hypothetical protein LSH36_341g02015 [Paralvinella palmiformis]
MLFDVAEAFDAHGGTSAAAATGQAFGSPRRTYLGSNQIFAIRNKHSTLMVARVLLLLLAASLAHLAGLGDCSNLKASEMRRAKELEGRSIKLAWFVMMQQFYRQTIRQTRGSSGIAKIQPVFDISDLKRWAYHPDLVVTPPIHSHPDKKSVLGVSDLSVVLHGVHFRTGHADYRLRTRSKHKASRSIPRDIPLPGVPPEVTRLEKVQDQVAEMRRWFRAWVDQDPSKRDYRKYFKPVLCYLEGAWLSHFSERLEQKFRAKSFDDIVMQVNIMFASCNYYKQQCDNTETGDTDDDFLPFRGNQLEEPSASTPKHRKRGRKSIISHELAATMDRTKLSDRKATFMLAATARSLGNDVNDYSIKRSSICRESHKLCHDIERSHGKRFSRSFTCYRV